MHHGNETPNKEHEMTAAQATQIKADPRMDLSGFTTPYLRIAVPTAITRTNSVGKTCYRGALGNLDIGPIRAFGFRTPKAAIAAVQKIIDAELSRR